MVVVCELVIVDENLCNLCDSLASRRENIQKFTQLMNDNLRNNGLILFTGTKPSGWFDNESQCETSLLTAHHIPGDPVAKIGSAHVEENSLNV
jgi:hypothetical protein